MKKKHRILITGGTGSFGQAFITDLLKKTPDIERIVIFSRDEFKQSEMRKKFNEKKYPGLRYFLGDIRDKDRLEYALQDIDIVVHAAALKQVPAAEYDPFEFIKTNVLGSQNLIEACLKKKKIKIIALSTDKAASPINLYGATKLCSDKLFIAANNIAGKKEVSFSIVRYGNVFGSRGSVLPLFLEKDKINSDFPITEPNMTRFNITLNEGVKFVNFAIENAIGGEIFVPKIPSFRIVDLADAINPNRKQKIVGLRIGEKLHESMISPSDSMFTYEYDKGFIILPPNENKFQKHFKKLNIKKVKFGFGYSSEKNNFLTLKQLQDLIREFKSDTL